MDSDRSQGSVLVCSPSSSLMNPGLCFTPTTSTAVSNSNGDPESMEKPKKKRPRARQRNMNKAVNCDITTGPNFNGILAKAEKELADLVDDMKRCSLTQENRKPKKSRNRKKQVGDKDTKDAEARPCDDVGTEVKRPSTDVNVPHNVLSPSYGIDVTDNVPSSKKGPKTPKNSYTPRSPKSNEQFFQDHKKSARKKKPPSENKKQDVFEDYLSPIEIEEGLRNKTMITGSIRINAKCFRDAYVSEGEEKDIIIEGLKNRNRALEGDEVVVLLNPPENWKVNPEQRTGKVVLIKEEFHSRTTVGKLQSTIEPNSSYVVFSPRDSRVPRIKIPLSDPSLPAGYKHSPGAYTDTIFTAQITAWTNVNIAEGKILKEVGKSGDVEAETMAILLENNLDPTPHDPILNIFFPRLPYTIPDEEIAKRDDLRKECIFTIDPATAKDLDDAVSAKKLENGNFEVGVHISDVSHFLQPKTMLDHKVSKRATTIYLVQRVYHMLPLELCQLCSLTSGEDKLAFSVFVELTPDAQVVTHRFARSVIHSCTKLAYEHAQMVIDDLDKTFTAEDFPEVSNGFTAEDCAERIRILYKLSQIMRKRRFDSGALRIDQPKLCFHLDAETQTPLSSFIYQNKESHRLIEEFMLLANMTVAEHIYTAYPDLAFLRHHLPPKLNMMLELQKRLETYGIHLDISDAGTLHSSMLKYGSPVEGEDETISWARYIVLNQMCAKPMLRANYFCPSKEIPELHHYALNAPYYTHFTSPIRRYADVMVHRLLAASLELTPPPTWSHLDSKRIATICNRQKLAAKVAGDQSSLLFLALYLREPVESLAAVIDVKDRSADVIVRDFGIVLRVYTDPLNAEIEHVSEANKSQLYIRWEGIEKVQLIQLFSVVRVLVSRDKNGLKLAATLLPSV
ncbi:DIS3-like exonuclease 2 [Macrosteles quadrilineatus]|uniref:DIS3-like exonuclease 2 n=1 Tax=Macrosteles quadrilineatus TaxID=74068 RepID=UPI0023E140DA|nr:DIS3-like exonuclease 2 [Macrosteles quadrilineatus]